MLHAVCLWGIHRVFRDAVNVSTVSTAAAVSKLWDNSPGPLLFHPNPIIPRLTQSDMCFCKRQSLHRSLRSSLCCMDWGNFGLAGRSLSTPAGTCISHSIKSPGLSVRTCLTQMKSADSVHGSTESHDKTMKDKCWSVSGCSGLGLIEAINGNVSALPRGHCHACLLPPPCFCRCHAFSHWSCHLTPFAVGFKHCASPGTLSIWRALPEPPNVLAPGLRDSWRSWNSYQRIPGSSGGGQHAGHRVFTTWSAEEPCPILCRIPMAFLAFASSSSTLALWPQESTLCEFEREICPFPSNQLFKSWPHNFPKWENYVL